MQKTAPLSLFLFGVLVFLTGAYFAIAPIVHAAAFPDPRQGADVIASSTAYTLTWGAPATRLVATSTGPGTRVALSLDATNCGTGGIVYLQHNDVPAATSTGKALTATTTMTYGDAVPMVRGSIRAMAAVASCTVLVTEWRASQ